MTNLLRPRRAGFAAAVAAVMTLSTVAAAAQNPAPKPAPPAPAAPVPLPDAIARVFDAAYNLDREPAIAGARQIVREHPDEPSAHRALAAVLWIDILFGRGAMTVDAYLGSMTKSAASLPKVPPDLEREFKGELDRAIALAEGRLARNAGDLQATFEAGNAYALQASYAASVDGSLMAAFKTARRAYDAQEQVLAREPQRARAGIVVGTYRYMVAGMSLPTRLFAYMAGFGGGKERGIGMIEAASRDPETRVDAGVALLFIYTREGRFEDALRVAKSLSAAFPRNRLLVLETGAAAIRADHPDEAEATLTRGLAEFDRDQRPKMPGERALWLYKRAAARVRLGRIAEADADIAAGLQSSPLEWVAGRLHLVRGKALVAAGRRADAIAAYKQAEAIAKKANDPAAAAEAARWIKKAFALDVKRMQRSATGSGFRVPGFRVLVPEFLVPEFLVPGFLVPGFAGSAVPPSGCSSKFEVCSSQFEVSHVLVP
jgi:tetratricopeptide (TPR) repeat protein